MTTINIITHLDDMESAAGLAAAAATDDTGICCC